MMGKHRACIHCKGTARSVDLLYDKNGKLIGKREVPCRACGGLGIQK